PTIAEVLTAFLRRHSNRRLTDLGPTRNVDSPLPLETWRPDLQAALTVLGRRKPPTGQPQSLDLSDSDLTAANLRDADLRDARLVGTGLLAADLTDAQLQGANLFGARLWRASLCGAQLQRQASSMLTWRGHTAAPKRSGRTGSTGEQPESHLYRT